MRSPSPVNDASQGKFAPRERRAAWNCTAPAIRGHDRLLPFRGEEQGGPSSTECTGSLPTKVSLARSTDGGRSFENYSWTREAFDPQRVFIGDYTGLAAYHGCVYGIWTEATPPPGPNQPGTAEPGGDARRDPRGPRAVPRAGRGSPSLPVGSQPPKPVRAANGEAGRNRRGRRRRKRRRG